MRNVRMAWVVVALVVLNAGLASAQSTVNLKGQDPPPLTVSTWINSDKPLTLAELKGQKVVLLEFFMVKCPHCVAALPQLKRLQDNYTEDGLAVICVTNDPMDTVKTFLQDKEIKLTVGIDSNYKTMVTYGVQGVPWSFLIGATGKVVWQGDPRSLDDIQLQSELVDLKNPPKEK